MRLKDVLKTTALMVLLTQASTGNCRNNCSYKEVEELFIRSRSTQINDIIARNPIGQCRLLCLRLLSNPFEEADEY